MEHQLWTAFEQRLGQLSTTFHPHARFQDKDIVRVFYGAVRHDRPTCWACLKDNGPVHARKKPLPSPSVLCRRLRSPAVLDLLHRLHRDALCPPGDAPLLWWVDGKPLPSGGASADRQAGYGRAARSKAKGYKLPAFVGSDGSVPIWRIAPLNTDERGMARRMARQAEIQGSLVGDAHFDDNPLHDVCLAPGERQLVTPRRFKNAQSTGHRRHSPSRLHSLNLISDPVAEFGRDLLRQRGGVERYFGNLTRFAGGLSPLPAWERTHRRVHRWVQAKRIVNALRMQLRKQTYVA
jgi:hypothetical protein